MYDFKLASEVLWPAAFPKIESTVVSLIANARRPARRVENFRHRGATPDWPEEWQQPAAFTRAVRNFYNVTRTYRETAYYRTLVERQTPQPSPVRPESNSEQRTSPPAPSFSPITNPPLSSSASSSRQPTAESASSRSPTPTTTPVPRQTSEATTAEEVIHHEPIGPERRTTMEDFTPEQQRTIAAIVSQVLDARPLPPGPAGPPGPVGPPGLDGNNNTGGSNNKWNPAELGFFDPHYDGKSLASGASPIDNTSKDTYFRDVHHFITRAKEMATTKGGQLVRDNLWLSLRGTALEWWTGELSDAERRMARMTMAGQEKLSEWVTLLHDRFKQPTNVAMNSLIHQRYTIRDAASQREPREYAQKIIRLAKDAGMTGVLNQLDLIYNGINIEVRSGTLRRPRESATINDMLNDLDEYKHEWWTKAARLRSSNNTGPPNRSQLPRQDARPFNQFGQYSASGNRQQQRPPFQSQSQPRYQNNAYQNYQYTQQPRQGYQQQQLGYQQSGYRPTGYQQQEYQPGGYSQGGQSSNARALPVLPNQPAPSNRLQITAPASGAASNSSQQQQPLQSSRQPFRPLSNNQSRDGYSGYGGYQSRPQPAYQASVSEETDENSSLWLQDDTSDSHWSNWREDEPQSEYSYASDGYDTETPKDVNFLTPSTIDSHSCERCSATFSSRNQLFKHLRDTC